MIPNQAQIKKKFIEELESNPIVQVACTKLSIPRSTYYRWIISDKDFSKKCNEARKISTPIINDLAESAIINNIKNGEFKSSKFWLVNNHPKYIKNNMRHAKLQMLLEKTKQEGIQKITKDREDIRELIELVKKQNRRK